MFAVAFCGEPGFKLCSVRETPCRPQSQIFNSPELPPADRKRGRTCGAALETAPRPKRNVGEYLVDDSRGIDGDRRGCNGSTHRASSCEVLATARSTASRSNRTIRRLGRMHGITPSRTHRLTVPTVTPKCRATSSELTSKIGLVRFIARTPLTEVMLRIGTYHFVRRVTFTLTCYVRGCQDLICSNTQSSGRWTSCESGAFTLFTSLPLDSARWVHASMVVRGGFLPFF